MAAQIKDLRELTGKCKGINSRGDARERLQAASKVLANTEPRTMAAMTRFAVAFAESKKLRELIKDALYDMGRETHGTGYDDFKPTSVTLEDIDYLDKTGLESILDYISAAAIVADSAVEARQDTDIETKKLKEQVKKMEVETSPMKKSLRDAKLNTKDIGRDPYARDSRDRYDRDDRRRDRDDRDDRGRDRDDRGRDDRRDSRDRITDRDREEATSRRRNRDDDRDSRYDDRKRDSRDDRDGRGRDRREDDRYDATRRRDRDGRRDSRDDRRRDRDDDRTPRDGRDRDDNRDRRDYDRDSYTGKNYATDLLEGFRKVLGNR